MSGNEVKLTNGDRWTWEQFLDHYFRAHRFAYASSDCGASLAGCGGYALVHERGTRAILSSRNVSDH
jgi:hypothetical protein